MKITLRQAFKFRLRTSPKVKSLLSNFAGAVRFLWNKMLWLNLERLKNGFRVMRYEEMAFWLTLWKQSEEYAFLNDIPSQALQQKLKDLDKSLKDYLDSRKKVCLTRFGILKDSKLSKAINACFFLKSAGFGIENIGILWVKPKT
jgi:transposase